MDSFLAEYNKDKLKRFRNHRYDSFDDFVRDSTYIASNIPPHELEVVRDQEIFDKKVREYDLSEEEFDDVIEFSSILAKYVDNLDSALEHGLSFIFYGFNESGKTVEAIRILFIALSKSFSGYYIDFRNLMNLHNDALYNNDPKEKAMLSHLLNCDFLVVDEIGKESSVTDNVVGSLERVIKTRSSRNLCTTVVTNLKMAENDLEEKGFKERYGNSVYSAMIRNFRCFQFSKDGKFRKKTQVDWDDVL